MATRLAGMVRTTRMAKAFVRAWAAGDGPVRVTHEVTHRCNLRCQFCGYWHSDPTGELPVERIREIMSSFRRLGTVSWGFTGGEPLLKPGIAELVAHAGRLGFYTNMVTNGTLIPERLDAIRGLAFVVVSLDGPKSVHDRLRGEGAFERTVAGIAAARRLGVPVVVQTIISAELVAAGPPAQVVEILSLAEGCGCRIMFQRLYQDPFLGGQGTARLLVDDERHREVVRFLRERRRQTPRLFFQSDQEFDYMLREAQHPPRCVAGRFYCLLDPRGQLVPCLYLRDRTVPTGDGGPADVKAAFGRLAKSHTCRCFNSCYNRYNHLFGLRLKTVWRTVCSLCGG